MYREINKDILNIRGSLIQPSSVSRPQAAGPSSLPVITIRLSGSRKSRDYLLRIGKKKKKLVRRACLSGQCGRCCGVRLKY